MPDHLLAALLAPPQSLGRRLAVLAVCIAFGSWMIVVGRHNVRTREAEETGKRAFFLALFGKSAKMQGRTAVFMGWSRVVLGVAMIVFGVVFLFFGAFLEK